MVSDRQKALGQGMLNGMATTFTPFLSWHDWYRFARVVLGYQHDESAEYANLRHVESQNRALLVDKVAQC